MYMKKIFSLIAGVAAAMSMQAASYTEAVQITMSCAGGPETQKVNLFVDPAQATVATKPNLASTYEIGQVNVYVADEKSEYKANAISNLPLAIVTNRRDVSYTFTFNVPVSTQGLVLTDLRSSEGVKNITMTNGDSYTFSVADEAAYAANTNVTIADRFVINYDPALASAKTNAHGLATFSFNQNVVAAEAGVKLYRGKVSGETLALTEVDFVEANQGVIVYGEVNHTYPFIAGAGTADFTDNELLAASAWSASHDGYDIYVLSGNALYLYEGTDFPANKAFLKIAQSANPSPRRIRLVFDQATAIDNISADNVKAEKVVENGQILIRRGNEVYNLQGQIVK
jgi:hypothetical protein